MTAGRRALDDEPVEAGLDLLHQRGRQHVRCHDGQKPGPHKRRGIGADELARVEGEGRLIALLRADHVQRIGRRLVPGQTIECLGNLERNPGADDHIAHAGQERTVERRQMRNLNFFEIIDADGVGVALACQPDLDEIRDDREFQQFARAVAHRHRDALIRVGVGLAARDEVGLPDPLGHRRHREMVERATHVAAGIAILKPPRQNLIERRSGDNSELPEFRHGVSQAPGRDARAHAALDDRREVGHLPRIISCAPRTSAKAPLFLKPYAVCSRRQVRAALLACPRGLRARAVRSLRRDVNRVHPRPPRSQAEIPGVPEQIPKSTTG